MLVGIYGMVKGILLEQICVLGVEIIFGNIFYLYLCLGLDVIVDYGGLYGFVCWNGLILIDFGGFQVFLLVYCCKIIEQGVIFVLLIDGVCVFFGLEESMKIQKVFDLDIVMIFDECILYLVIELVVCILMELSLCWVQCSCNVYDVFGNDVVLFGIVQGGVYYDLCICLVEGLQQIGFDGYVIGGLVVGEFEYECNVMLDYMYLILLVDCLCYLMGVGCLEDLVEGVVWGVDMFDCVMFICNVCNGYYFILFGIVCICNVCYECDMDIIELGCGCYVCSSGYIWFYLCYLDCCNEMLVLMLGILYNLYYYEKLMVDMCVVIVVGIFLVFCEFFYVVWGVVMLLL